MRVSLFGIAVVLLVVAVGYREVRETGRETAGRVNKVSRILEQAVEKAPPLPEGPKTGRWARHVNATCARRERELQRLRRPASPLRIGGHAQRVLGVHRRFARRLFRLQPPEKYSTDAHYLDTMSREHLRLLGQARRAARSRDLAAMHSAGAELRVFLGQANGELLQRGFGACLLRPSGLPL